MSALVGGQFWGIRIKVMYLVLHHFRLNTSLSLHSYRKLFIVIKYEHGEKAHLSDIVHFACDSFHTESELYTTSL